MKYKVVISESMGEEGINLLRYNPNYDVVVLDKKENERLLKEVVNADAVIVRSSVFMTKEILDHTTQLKIVGRAGAGFDNIDVQACSKKGVAVMIAPTGNTNGVVELTMGLMLSLIRHIPTAVQTMKQGIWAKNDLEGSELEGKTIGIVGLGKIGMRVAQLCEAFGMHVIALVPNKSSRQKAPIRGEFVDKLDEMLPRVDFLTFHVPLNATTKEMISKPQLAKMKPSAFIINTARGNIVSEKDLYDALVEKKIAGAAIDVYSKEPVKKDDFPFVSLPNVIAIPHLGASTKESQARTSRIIVQNIMEALEHGIYFDAVNLPFNIAFSDAELYRPVIRLAKRLGQFAGSFFGQTPTTITIKHRLEKIDQVKPVTIALLTNILSKTDPLISLVNIEEKLAEKHIEVFISPDLDLTYNNSIRVTLGNGIDSFDAKGTFVFTIPKIVEVQHYYLDIVPMGRMMIIRNLNVPGVIGAVGTLLGKNGINISDFHYAQASEGKETLGCVTIDEDIPDDVLAKVKALENVVDVKKINIE